MILRSAGADDEFELETFDLGEASSPWLDEVREIVSGLIAWRGDQEHTAFDRQVIMAESDGAIVAVAAHEGLESAAGRPLNDHRYLMVVAGTHGSTAKRRRESPHRVRARPAEQ